MRTTVEITDVQRAQLLQIAASRGEKGFSGVVRDALDRYLLENAGRGDLVRAARAARGAIRDRQADELAARVSELRGSWR